MNSQSVVVGYTEFCPGKTFDKVLEEISPHLLLKVATDKTWSKTNDWVQSKINFLEVPKESPATVTRRKLAWVRHVRRHDSLSNTTFRTPRREGDAAVSGGNAGRTRSKSGCSCLCRNCWRWPLAETTGRGSLLFPIYLCFLFCSNMNSLLYTPSQKKAILYIRYPSHWPLENKISIRPSIFSDVNVMLVHLSLMYVCVWLVTWYMNRIS